VLAKIFGVRPCTWWLRLFRF